MDETAKPLRIPLEMSVYADSHRVLQLIQDLVSGLVINRPEDPVQWLVSELKRPCEELPRVLLLGPPAVGKHTVATRLAAELRAVHLTTESLLNDQSEQSVQARTCLKDGQEIPVELLTALIQQRLREPDCFNRGWVLVGLPQSRLQALGLQRAGVLPEHVVLLEAPDDVLLERNRGRLIDPTTGEAYHQTYILPDNDDVAKRLVKGQGLSEKQLLACLHRYRCEVTGLRFAYKQTLKEFNSDQPHQDVYQQVLGFVQTRVSFRIPRVLLLGPPGSGKSLQAEQLCHKYNLINGTSTHSTHRITDTTHRVTDTNHRVRETNHRDTNHRVRDTTHRVIDPTCRVRDTNHRDTNHRVRDTTHRVIDPTRRARDTNHRDTNDRVRDTTHRVIDSTRRVLDTTRRVTDTIHRVTDTTR